MSLVTRTDDASALDATDSSLLFVVNSLLIPAIPVLTLLACLTIHRVSLRGAYFLLAVLTFLLASDFLGSYRLRDTRRAATLRLLDICGRWVLLLAFVGGLVYLGGLAAAFDSHVLMTWAISTPAALMLGQASARQIARARHAKRSSERVVIVGMTELGIRLERALRRDRVTRVQVMGYFDDRQPERLPTIGRKRILGTTAELADYVHKEPVGVVYITLPMSRDQRIRGILDQLRDSTASIYFVPDLLAFNSIQARFDVMHGIPVVAVCESPFYGVPRLVKRLSDILIASLAILVAAPILLAVALAIRLDTPGPIIFKQKRYGLNGREILVYKFRSMTVTEDGAARFTAATRHDTRITSVGAFIRKTSLDELPQLFNVLEGSMSMIGPRPHPVAMNEQYRRLIPSYMVRHKVKPGITGWAQVNGYRGGNDLESMRKRIEFDLAYLQHWSLWLDCKILLKTFTVIWTDPHAY